MLPYLHEIFLVVRAKTKIAKEKQAIPVERDRCFDRSVNELRENILQMIRDVCKGFFRTHKFNFRKYQIRNVGSSDDFLYEEKGINKVTRT